MGQLDRGLRLLGGLGLVSLGLFALNGWLQASAIVVSLPLIVTGLIGFCPGYVPFGVSTLHRDQKSVEAGRG